MIVQIYKNLHKSRAAGQNIYSIKNKATGLVTGYTEDIVLKDATFKVSEAGRQRVIREHRKNVHAKIEGKIYNGGFYADTKISQVFYNPYKVDQFTNIKTGEKVYSSRYARICADGVFIK